MSVSITRTEAIVKPGLAEFVPFRADTNFFETEEAAQAEFETALDHYTGTYGHEAVERDGNQFVVQTGPFAKVSVELNPEA